MKSESHKIEPYRLFFPLGIPGAILASGIWFFYWLSNLQFISFNQSYPAIFHSEQMFGLFLLPILSGFLFTFIPRATASELPSLKMLLLFFAGEVILFSTAYLENRIYFFILFLLLFTGLGVFTFDRLSKIKLKFLGSLIFLPGGLLLGIIGLGFIVLSLTAHSTFLHRAGKSLLYYGMMPALIFAIGSKLILPLVASGNPEIRAAWFQKLSEISHRKVILFFLFFSLAFIIELLDVFIFQTSYLFSFYRGILFLTCSIWMVKYFHIFEIKHFKGASPALFLVSSYSFVIGLGGIAIFPNYAVHFAHFYFIGGISLLILVIMTRVVLSHGGQDLEPEKKSKWIYAMGILLVLAALTRVTVFLVPAVAVSHYAYAALFFITTLIIWLVRFGKFMFKS